MSKPEWGEKRECPECGVRFYDLKRDPVVCPKCETPHLVTVAKTAGTVAGGSTVESAEPASAGGAGTAGLEREDGDVGKLPDMDVDGAEDDEEEDDLIEDAAELVEEGDDVSDVLDDRKTDG